MAVSLPTPLPIAEKKFITNAYTRKVGDASHIYVSVMHEDGTPGKGLSAANFRVAEVVEFAERPINNFQENGRGFYHFTLVPDVNQADRIVNVEAFKTVGLGKYRGQCLAAMQD